MLETIEEGIISTYSRHSDMTKEELADAMAAETWMTGDQFAEHFVKGVTVTPPVEAVACSTDLAYRRWPKAVAQTKEVPVDLWKMELEIALALN